VDSAPASCESLRLLLDQQPDLVVSGEAGDAECALREISIDIPDLVILDISLNASSGLDLIRKIRLRAPRLPVLVFSSQCETLYAERCIRAGARGYVGKQQPPQTLLAGIRDVLDGHLSVSAQVSANFARSAMDRRPHGQRQPLNVLSDRELEVFSLMGRGFVSRKIAQSLNVNVKTVQTHSANIKRKLGLTTAELLREAMRWDAETSGQISHGPLGALDQAQSAA
jgi:DNA-binding NarL/FixJ family response regulator